MSGASWAVCRQRAFWAHYRRAFWAQCKRASRACWACSWAAWAAGAGPCSRASLAAGRLVWAAGHSWAFWAGPCIRASFWAGEVGAGPCSSASSPPGSWFSWARCNSVCGRGRACEPHEWAVGCPKCRSTLASHDGGVAHT